MPPAVPRLRRHLVDLLLGLLVTAVLACLLEVGFRVLGPAAPPADYSRGFDSRASYLIPDPERPGGFRTQFSEGRFAERRIPPRDDRVRVVLLGGSNTDGLSAEALEALLNRDGGGFEVLNLGRRGYGSGRVAILAEQALELLSPDVLVVYSGHNEFVERSFQMDVGEGWRNPLRRLAESSRLVQWVAEGVAEGALAGGAVSSRSRSPKSPEAWKMEYDKFRGLSFEDTVQVWEAYRANLRALCQGASERGVPVLLCTVVYNHYSAPFESSLPEGLEASVRREFEVLRDGARSRLPGFLEPLLPQRELDRVHGPDWRAGTEARELPSPDFGRRPGRGALAEMPSGHPPPSDWDAKVWELWTALDRLYAGVRDPAQRGQLEEAEELLVRALELCEEHPSAHFELGLVQQSLGREPATYAAHLRRAATLDRAPRRANDHSNRIVREVARESEGARLLDAERRFAERVPDGLMGWEWMADHCHLVTGSKRVLLADLAQALREIAGRGTSRDALLENE